MTSPPPRSRRSAAPRAQSGFTIIEVLVAALILAIVAAGSAVAFVGAVGQSGLDRNRSAAEALAQQDEAKLRGYTVNQLANLSNTVTQTVNGTQFSIAESGSFVSDSSGSPSCTNPSADYLQTTSTVTWAGMPSALKGVTVTGLITPTAGQISSSAGILAVQVQSPAPNPTPFVGMPVSVAQTGGGSGAASGVTASNGCVLFADLPVGNYTVSVAPASGSFVDAATNQVVSASSPDTAPASVTAGTTAANAQTITLATPGSALFTFKDLWPSGVAPTAGNVPIATSPSVILASGNLTATPSYIVCSNQDATCPAVGQADTSWGQSAWAGNAGTFTDGNLGASPLAPYSYNTYAGLCQSDDPTSYGGAYTVANVTSGGNPTVGPISLPSIVVRLWSGTGTISILGGLITLPGTAGSEIAMPTGSKLVITDTGCGEPFVGGPNVTVPTGDSYLPIDSTPPTTAANGAANDTGLLNNPGMPYGKYTVCYQNGTKDSTLTLTNSGNGEIVNIYQGSLTTGTCAT